ncbi:F-box/kelch-repeat protein At3g23880-like [Rutidosis leptorrhynchoides]|uniref:F-box/kelch-repeat protein At3g23880-like n=1 Tax=Rutidosis leptorrhynchoides TaxID=125765 RepID=UPI003A99299B
MSSYICDELLEEIFKRLPSKTLLQLRSLSKSWCSRISNPNFILKQTALQSARNADQKILIKHKVNYFENFYTLLQYQSTLNSKPMKFPTGYIVASCNGIICLHDPHSFNANVSLWNPSIRRKLTIPYPGFYKYYSKFAGFGFDSNTNDYKIVLLFYRQGEQNKTLVYSLKKRVWCEITPPSTLTTGVKSPACFFNGVLHWGVENYRFGVYILTFDLTTHIFSKITMPEDPNFLTICPIIYKGCLGMLFSTWWHYRLLVMKEYNDNTSWYTVSTLENLQFEGPIDVALQLTNGNLLIKNDKFVYEIGVCSPLCVRESSKFSIDSMVMYVESLALLDIGTLCDADQPYFIRKKKNKRMSRLLCFRF